jgi:hypothetical protein
MAVDTIAVEPMIVMNRIDRKTAGLFINRNLDNMNQNYAKLKFNTKFILGLGGSQLFTFDKKDPRNCSLASSIRRFCRFFPVH